MTGAESSGPDDAPEDVEHYRLCAITLDESASIRLSPTIDHERKVAIFDLLEDNSFRPTGSGGGPYHLHLGIEENRLVFDVRTESGGPHGRVILALSPFRKLVKDYFTVCESYFHAIRRAPPSQIEALDMGRRALHDEGSELLRQRLAGKIAIDFATARRLYTLICVLHLKA
jgi:uncharacterized protein (UPF0262 family)